jgi:redox-sensitive bicupin YhaK (pirin superfamily)
LVDGTQLQVLASPAEQTQLSGRSGVHLAGDGTFQIRNTGTDQARVLLLEGEPILEPLVQYGPFILNTQDEIRLAFQEFRQTGFGGWPWSRPDPVHGREARSFFKAPGSG